MVFTSVLEMVHAVAAGGSRHRREKAARRRKSRLDARNEVDALFAKYDADGSGDLDKEEVARLMIEIGGGAANVQYYTDLDADVAFVVKQADTQTGDGKLIRVRRREGDRRVCVCVCAVRVACLMSASAVCTRDY